MFASSVAWIDDAWFTYLVLRLMFRLSDYKLVQAFAIIPVSKYAESVCVWLLILVYCAVSVVSISRLTLVTAEVIGAEASTG